MLTVYCLCMFMYVAFKVKLGKPFYRSSAVTENNIRREKVSTTNTCEIGFNTHREINSIHAYTRKVTRLQLQQRSLVFFVQHTELERTRCLLWRTNSSFRALNPAQMCTCGGDLGLTPRRRLLQPLLPVQAPALVRLGLRRKKTS